MILNSSQHLFVQKLDRGKFTRNNFESETCIDHLIMVEEFAYVVKAVTPVKISQRQSGPMQGGTLGANPVRH